MFGIVTLVTNSEYAEGALVLGHSVRSVGSAAELVCLVTANLNPNSAQNLKTLYDKVLTVDIYNSKDSANLALLRRPELGVTLTKLHCWASFPNYFFLF